VGKRLVGLSLLVEGEPQAVLRLWVRRLETERLPVLDDGLIGPPFTIERDAQLVVRVPRAWIQADRL
jgi:hypothetical protein